MFYLINMQNDFKFYQNNVKFSQMPLCTKFTQLLRIDFFTKSIFCEYYKLYYAIISKLYLIK